MSQACPPVAEAGVVEAEVLRRKKRQGTETRNMGGRLQVRYDRGKLRALEAVAGDKLPSLIRQYGDLLTQLLPVADERGVDPVDLIRETATSLLGASA
uniref:Uncharacterized protein n=1 Tax=Mycobacterium riyadhense TaxID=486698 RepID=A0A653F4N1_9MYCO|nr:hypothetical protein BIN_B_05667 [Mycobacterium riyadhense]